MTSTVPEQPAASGPVYNLRYIWFISLVAAMGGLLFGYDWVVIGGAKPFFEKYFQLDRGDLSGWANSCALLGCLLGSLLAGGLSDKLGRKKLLLAAATLFAVSSVLTGWAPTFSWFVAWRIIGGVAIGMASNLSPMYIAEVAPAHLRGRLVAMNQLTIVLGVLGAQIVNWLIAQKVPEGATAEAIRQSWNGQYGWRWMFTAVTVPSLMFFFGALFLPESPRWLVKNGMVDQARRILGRIGGPAHAAAEVAGIQGTLATEEIQHVRFQDLLEPKMFRILMVGAALAVLQQWSGINVIYNYAEEVFHAAGYDVSSTLFNIVLTGVVALVFTLIALRTVDQFGRRALMLRGLRGHCFFPHAHRLRLRARAEGADGGHSVAGHAGLLRVFFGPGNLGVDFGNLPQSHSRCGGVGGRFLLVDRLFHPHVHLPAAQSGFGPRPNLLALRRHLHGRLCVHLPVRARDKRQDPGANRAGTGRLSK